MDNKKLRKAKILNDLWLNFWIFLLLFIFLAFFHASNLFGTLFISIILLFGQIIVGWVKNSGYINQASFLFIFDFWIIITITSFFAGGLLTFLSVFYIIIDVEAGMLLGRRAAIVLALFSLLFAIIYIVINCCIYSIPIYFPIAENARIFLFTLMFFVVSSPISIAITTYEKGIDEAQKSESKYKELSQKLEELVLERTKDLEESNKELSFYNYSISHDLKNPLNSINGFSELILKDYATSLNDNIVDLLAKINTKTSQMKNLIDDLLIFFRFSNQKLYKRKIDLDNIVKNVLEGFYNETKNRKIQVIKGTLGEIEADETLLTQVWSNLISNAIKYTKNQNEPIITIGLLQEEQKKIFYIKDNGIGFDMAQASKLFHEFIRLNSSSEYEGSGIGLALTKKIIDRHGGDVWAESE